MIRSPGKVASSLNPQCLHLRRVWLTWNFTLLFWNYIGENIIKARAQALNWISSREKQNSHQSVQGKESIWSNCYSFARRCEQTLFPTHLFCWVACAGMCVCICCSSWSVAGKLSWGQQWECWWWGGRTGWDGRAEDNCFLLTIHPESRSFEKLALPLLLFAV